MDNTSFLASIIGPMYLILGLSILLYAKQWKKLVGDFQKNHFTLLSMMMFNLIFGLIIIQIHNIWEWSPWVIITLTGWIAFLKGVFYFLAPGNWIKSCMKLSQNMTYLYVAGLIVTFFGAWISYLIYLA